MELGIQRYGELSLLVSAPRFEDLGVRRVLDVAFAENAPLGYLKHVWGAENLLVLFRSLPSEDLLRIWFAGLGNCVDAAEARCPLHDVPVVYDGSDLDAVAAMAGLSAQEVVALHSEPEYRVRMMGFSPGFPYLDGLNPRLQLPRREAPRKRIETGAVAIGGPHAGIYSVASPGGWHLLGRTDLRLFKPELAAGASVDATTVFAFRPGDRVRFVPVREGGEL
ncbi:MAG: 5-oxoprolinase subunit B family protein [Coraliomargarita sp.]